MTNPIIEIRIKGMGTMTAELYPAVAPKTVANFVKLAEEKGFVPFEYNKKYSAGDKIYHHSRKESAYQCPDGKVCLWDA